MGEKPNILFLLNDHQTYEIYDSIVENMKLRLKKWRDRTNDRMEKRTKKKIIT
jgi:hypothetical protein